MRAERAAASAAAASARARALRAQQLREQGLTGMPHKQPRHDPSGPPVTALCRFCARMPSTNIPT